MRFCWIIAACAAFAADPNLVRAKLAEGQSALTRNDLAGARQALDQATKLAPRNPAAWLLLAETCARQKDDRSAADAAGSAATLGASDPAILHGLAGFYLQHAPDPAKAADFEFRYAELQPADKGAFERAARVYFEIGKPEQAIRAGLRAVQAEDTAAVHAILGESYALLKTWDKAVEELSLAVKMSPYEEGPIFDLSQAYLYREDFASAVRVLEAGRKSFDKSPQIELALGVAYYGLRRFPDAVAQFLNTIRLAPGVPQPYIFLGRMLEHISDRLPEVIDRFAQLEASRPESPMGYLLHGKAIAAQLPPGGFPPEAAEAETLIRKALSLKEDDAESHFQLGCLLDRKREFDAAAKSLERSAQLEPKDPATHYRLSRVYDRLGRAADAEAQRKLHTQLSESADKTGMQTVAPAKLP